MGGWGGGGGIPSDYLVSTQLQFWLFCYSGCGSCWAVTISSHDFERESAIMDPSLVPTLLFENQFPPNTI